MGPMTRERPEWPKVAEGPLQSKGLDYQGVPERPRDPRGQPVHSGQGGLKDQVGLGDRVGPEGLGVPVGLVDLGGLGG